MRMGILLLLLLLFTPIALLLTSESMVKWSLRASGLASNADNRALVARQVRLRRSFMIAGYITMLTYAALPLGTATTAIVFTLQASLTAGIYFIWDGCVDQGR